MAKQTLQQLKKILVGKNVFLFRLLDPFPHVDYLSGVDNGYFAANIAMAYRHFKFKEPAGTLTKFSPASPISITAPSFRNVMPLGGIVLGNGSTDDFWTAEQIRQVATKHGYGRSEIHHGVSFDAIKDLISQQHAVVAAFDANAHGDPGCYGGANAQWCVILGFAIFKDGSKSIIATHSWGGFYLWNIDAFAQSNIQLLSLPAQVSQKQLVNSSPTPAVISTTAVSLNEVRNKLVLIRV